MVFSLNRPIRHLACNRLEHDRARCAVHGGRRTMKSFLAWIAATGALVATGAQATPIRLDGPETNLQQILNTYTGSGTLAATTDQHALDEAFAFSGFNIGLAGLIVEPAGDKDLNAFGISDLLDPPNRPEIPRPPANACPASSCDAPLSIPVTEPPRPRHEVLGGHANACPASSCAAAFTLPGTCTSSVFGFYLDTPDGLWFSQSSLNTDGADHMVAYQLGGSYIFGWEDLASSRWD